MPMWPKAFSIGAWKPTPVGALPPFIVAAAKKRRVIDQPQAVDKEARQESPATGGRPATVARHAPSSASATSVSSVIVAADEEARQESIIR